MLAPEGGATMGASLSWLLLLLVGLEVGGAHATRAGRQLLLLPEG